MPFALQQLHDAYKAYRQFLAANPCPHHARYIFPFFAGSYFSYRKVDVMRVAAVAKSVSSDPAYIDVGCGYGDFLGKIREYLPRATGLEKEVEIFYSFQVSKPEYISLMPIEAFSQECDVTFVGWMEPWQDFRKDVSRFSKCVITTFDAGGQCGINGGCEYEEFGYKRFAWWRTPSWIDVNAELMNNYYTKGIDKQSKEQLAKLRSAHNFWYVYARPDLAGAAKSGLKAHLEYEDSSNAYDFEYILDELGFGYKQSLASLTSGSTLWEVNFD